MDVYLPADFREIHDAAPDDWRDLSSTARAEPARCDGSESPNDCADPLWRVF
ncbi:MAG TPA: hypothetical protein VF132_01840 [Rudaea sp.]